MNPHPFELVPLLDSKIPEIKITGSIARERNVLIVKYFLSGKIDEILFPELNPQPGRKYALWLATCFEFFLAFPGQPQYWEFNLSPSGDWNVFRMDSYRQIGFREEESIQNPRLDKRQNMNYYQLNVTFDLRPILVPDMQIQAGIASVIKTQDGHETYWALTHLNSRPDFHLRESFLLKI
jgi:hypothetical protein